MVVFLFLNFSGSSPLNFTWQFSVLCSSWWCFAFAFRPWHSDSVFALYFSTVLCLSVASWFFTFVFYVFCQWCSRFRVLLKFFTEICCVPLHFTKIVVSFLRFSALSRPRISASLLEISLSFFTEICFVYRAFSPIYRAKVFYVCISAQFAAFVFYYGLPPL